LTVNVGDSVTFVWNTTTEHGVSSVPSLECPDFSTNTTKGVKELTAPAPEGSYKFKAKKAGTVSAFMNALWQACDTGTHSIYVTLTGTLVAVLLRMPRERRLQGRADHCDHCEPRKRSGASCRRSPASGRSSGTNCHEALSKQTVKPADRSVGLLCTRRREDLPLSSYSVCQ
jgi:hypothetical protein